MKWQTFQAFNVTDEQSSDSAFWPKATEAYEHFKKFRSEVIEAGLFIESGLTNVLLDFLSGPNQQRRDILKEQVLEAEFCSFFQKWKLLRQLLELYAESLGLDETKMKELRKELKDVISLRNRFAHGVIYVDAQTFAVWIEYVEGGEHFEQILEADLVNAKDACDRVHASLWHVHEAIAARGYELPAPKA